MLEGLVIFNQDQQGFGSVHYSSNNNRSLSGRFVQGLSALPRFLFSLSLANFKLKEDIPVC